MNIYRKKPGRGLAETMDLMNPGLTPMDSRDGAAGHVQAPIDYVPKEYEPKSISVANVNAQPEPVQEIQHVTPAPGPGPEHIEAALEPEAQEENVEYDPGGMNQSIIEQAMAEFFGESVMETAEAEMEQQEVQEMEEKAEMSLEMLAGGDPFAPGG